MRRWIGLAAVFPASAFALGQLLPAPAGSQRFGQNVVFLPNGNFVVTDPQWSGTDAEGAGAVYLYSSAGVLLSRLTGSQTDDNVGSGGVLVLANGNFVVRSPFWDQGATVDAGAVTFGDAAAGFGPDAEVDTLNSLFGTADDQRVGEPGVFALPNGNYVVASDHWGTAASPARGAVTWGDGTSGTNGPVATTNSHFGTHAQDHVGSTITVLTNGNYVITSPSWDSDSLVDAGAVTACSGDQPSSGAISELNSLIGASADDMAGSGGTIALTGGNFVFASPLWDDGTKFNAGAVTWHAGDVETMGVLGIDNSLIGFSKGDNVGSGGLIGLTNGHYAFASPDWDSGSIQDAGAVSRGNGTVGSIGLVSALQSMLGNKAGDRIGSGGVVAIGGGNFVALSPEWHDNTNVAVGAATRLLGSGATTGPLDAKTSLRGNFAGDLALARVTALTNQNYVVSAPAARIGNTLQAGAVAWCAGHSSCGGVLSASTAIVGSSPDDAVGSGGVTALPDGNYVVASPSLDIANIVNIGAVTWGDGTAGSHGVITSANALVGASQQDQVGLGGILPLFDHDFVMFSPAWNQSRGAISLGQGGGVFLGDVNGTTSVHGSDVAQQLGLGHQARLTQDGLLILTIPNADNGALAAAGAVAILDTHGPFAGPVDLDAGIRGATAQGGIWIRLDWQEATRALVVGDPLANRVWLARLDLPNAIFQDGFED